MNQGHNLKEMKNPHLERAITGGRREAPTMKMNIAKMSGLFIGLMTTTRMISEGMMDTPTEEALKSLLTMIGMNIPKV